MKEKMGMKPLLVSVEDNFPMTKAGVHNLKNISEAFGCDLIYMKEGTMYYYNAPKGSYMDMYLAAPAGYPYQINLAIPHL